MTKNISNYSAKLMGTKKEKLSNIIAVGVELSMENVKEHLSKYIPEEALDTYEFETDTKPFGVFYGDNAQVGRWTGMKKSRSDLLRWYKKNEGSELSAYFNKVYITPKVILLSGNLLSKSFMVVASNMTSGNNTFLHKKNANTGQYGPGIPIDRLTISGMPYIYKK